MKCREFERELADWVAGRLSPERALQMQSHESSCLTCRQAALEERAFQQRWAGLPAAPQLGDIWPRLSQRLTSTVPAKRPVMLQARMLAAAACVAIFCAVQWDHAPRRTPDNLPAPIAGLTEVDDHHIVEVFSDFQRLSDSEGSTFVSETQNDRQVQRSLLLGKEKQ